MKANVDNLDLVSGPVTGICLTLEKLLILIWQHLALPLAVPLAGRAAGSCFAALRDVSKSMVRTWQHLHLLYVKSPSSKRMVFILKGKC